jgi:hypothetical protein
MSFRNNLIKARGHIVFLVALGVGLAAVLTLEQRIDGLSSASPDPGITALATFDTVEPLPIPAPATPTADQLKYAAIAWTYFRNNINPTTGLVNSADGYPSTTMWETGSMLIAVISADRLGLIEPIEAKVRISKALETLTTIRLFDGILPNKAYNVETGELVDYSNKPVERGLGWSALDIGRLVAALSLVEHTYPELAPKVFAVINRFDLSQVVENGYLIGGNLSEGELRRDQEGRIGYEQYASRAFMQFGFDAVNSYRVESNLTVVDVEGQPIPADTRLYRGTIPSFVVTEPYILDGLEFGFDARSHRFATAVYKAQEARFLNQGILTAVTETHMNEEPYFIYSSVWGGGAPWAVMTFSGDRKDSKRTISAKVAFAFDALFHTDYSAKLVAAVAPLGDPERGFPEGLYEADGSTNTSVTANTNGIILAALAFGAGGPLIRASK